MICIFYATSTPNAQGLYNWVDFKPFLSKGRVPLNVLQDAVGGRIELLPCIDEKSPFIAYVNDEALMKADFGRNELAGGALYHLGFRGSAFLGMAYAGNVVLVAKTEAAFGPKYQAKIEKAIAAYRKECGETEEESDPESQDTNQPDLEEKLVITITAEPTTVPVVSKKQQAQKLCRQDLKKHKPKTVSTGSKKRKSKTTL